MKSTKKAKAKTLKKPKARSKPKHRTHRPSKPETSQASIESSPIPTLSSPALSANTCQEVEVGDIGGFGSTEELEEHEKRCSETATEFCKHCGKNLCRNHYDLMHRDHDITGQTASPSPA